MPTESIADELLTTAQSRAFLGISKMTFWYKCKSGEIPLVPIKRGRCKYYRRSDLEAIKNTTMGATHEQTTDDRPMFLG